MTFFAYQQSFKKNFGVFEFVDSQSNITDGQQTKPFDVVAPSGKNVLAFLVDMTCTLTNSATSTTSANSTNTTTGVAPTTLDLFLQQMYVKPTVQATYRSDTLISTDAALIEQLSFNLMKRTYPFTTAPSVAASTSSSVEVTLFVPCGGPEGVWYCVAPTLTNTYSSSISITNRTYNIYGIYGETDDVVVFHTQQSDVKPSGGSSLLDQQPDNISPDFAVIYGPNAAYITQLLATTPDRVVLNALDTTVINLCATVYPDLATTFANEIVLAPAQERFRTWTITLSSSSTQRTLWMQWSGAETTATAPNPAATPQPAATGNVVGGASGPTSGYHSGGGAPNARAGGSRGGIIPRRVA
jgi:hypothetical protein